MATGANSICLTWWSRWDGHVEELIALTGDYRVARLDVEAVKRWPGRIVTFDRKQDCWLTAVRKRNE
jgi:hypothetical protein